MVATATQEYTVAQVGTEQADGEKTIYLAVRALAGVCDGARKQDGVGFNGRDTEFGNSLAERPWEQWTFRMRLAAHKMLRTYRNTQLPKFGIDYDAIPVPSMPRCTSCGSETERGPLCRSCWDAQRQAPAPAPAAAPTPHVSAAAKALGGAAVTREQAFIDGARAVVGITKDGTCLAIHFNGEELVVQARQTPDVEKQLVATLWEGAAAFNRTLAEHTGIQVDRKAAAAAAAPARTPSGLAAQPSSVAIEDVDDKPAILVRFAFNRAMMDGIKQVPGRHWDGQRKAWVVPVQIDSLEPLMAFLDKYQFPMTDQTRATIKDFARMFANRVEASHATDADFEVKGLAGELRPFQRAGVRFMTAVKRPLCADDMGLGKTIQAMATVQHLKAYPALIVAPKNVVEKWRREWVKWVPGVHVAVLGSKLPAGWQRCHVAITSYEMMKKHLPQLIKANYQAVVLDEAHMIKNPKAQRSEAALQLVEEWEMDGTRKVKLLRSTGVRIALTGTPIENNHLEVVNLIRWLGWEREVGGWRFFNSIDASGSSKGASDLHELNRRLRSLFMVRRLKTQVLTELPPLTRDVLPFELSNRKEYEQAEYELANWVGQRKAANEAAIAEDRAQAQAAGLQPGTEEYQAYLAEAASERYDKAAEATARAEHLVRFEHLKTLAWEGKRDAVYQWIDGLLASGQKLVVFAWHTAAIKEVAERYGAVTITGEDSQPKRQAAMDAFQNDPACSLIVCNIKAGGVGVDLYAASNVLFIELGWNPGQHRQAEDRLNRMGQQNAVTSYYALGTIGGDESNTIDGEIYELILAKATVVDAATDGEGQAVQTNVIKQLQQRLEARVAARGHR